LGEHLSQFSLTNRIAVVTGASEGIGEAIALGLAEAGADVIVCSRREEKLKEVKSEIEKMGRRAEVFVLDVCELSTGSKKRISELAYQRSVRGQRPGRRVIPGDRYRPRIY